MAKSKRGKTPQAKSLLIELLTEELPPKSLAHLGRAFEEGIYDGLVLRGLLIAPSRHPRALATPRRLAVQVPNVLDMASDRPREFTGPSVKAPPEAVAGFAKKHGTDVKALEQRDTPKGRVFVANVTLKGAALDAVLAEIVVDALKKLPIPKIMRWGTSDEQFVRPVHGLVMLHGSRTVPGRVLGLESGNRTRGHRFMGSAEIVLSNADTYEKKLLEEGKVLVDFEKRKSEVDRQLQAEVKNQNASLGEYQVLLDEVAALVEHPTVYVGEFDKAFLEVPQECLILTMRQNQKY
ncbi:MAG TPA: glycine--tRNA ligase subunit beta, partial [Gemmatimonadaceae bacterium]|nr:glycine--tRNA ligase subunit beta [Gemmatimonadaceae bacterium]